MKAEKCIAKPLAAFALICGFFAPAHAQIGCGWVPGGETYVPQTSAGCTITPIPGGLEFHVPSGHGRAEERGSGIDETDTWQWIGDCTVVSFPSGSNNVACHQVFGPPPSTPDIILDIAQNPSGGLELISLEQSRAFLAPVQVGVKFNLATIYDANGGNPIVYFYFNSSRVGSQPAHSGAHYDKYGAYVSLSGNGPATFDWVNVSTWAHGSLPENCGTQVATPTFNPPAGTYSSAQTVTISTATSGASIAYTTDGSTPTESGGTVTHGTLLANGGAVYVASSMTLQALGFKPGDADSIVATAGYIIGSTCLTAAVGGSWQDAAMSSSQSDTFTATFDSTPSTSPNNAVVALSDGAQTDYTGFACLVRFNTSGHIDARNGGSYAAASAIPFAAGSKYHFRLVINVPSHTYSVFVTPPGETELMVGSDFAFRAEQNTVASLNYWGTLVGAASIGGSGSVTTCDFTSTGGGGTCVTASAGGSWQDTAMSASQSGTFTSTFDVTPSASPNNAIVALSNGAQTAYTDFACLVRFNTSGHIDARNGGAYAAASTIPFSAGLKYHFRLVVDVPSHTYSIFVTPPGGTELTVGSNFAFRTEQNTVTSLNYWGAFVDSTSSGGNGALTVCNFMP